MKPFIPCALNLSLINTYCHLSLVNRHCRRPAALKWNKWRGQGGRTIRSKKGLPCLISLHTHLEILADLTFGLTQEGRRIPGE